MSIFDEAQVVEGHRQFLPLIQGSVSALRTSCHLIRETLLHHNYGNENEIAVSLLGFRIVNDVGTCTKLADAGYFVQAAALFRDLAEIGMLTLYFSNDTSRIGTWRKVTGVERYRLFGRKKLKQDIELKKFQFLDRYFNEFSEIGVHPSEFSHRLHIHEGSWQIGPHINKGYFVNIHKDLACLAWHVTDAANECWIALGNEASIDQHADLRREFVEAFNVWTRDGD